MVLSRERFKGFELSAFNLFVLKGKLGAPDVVGIVHLKHAHILLAQSFLFSGNMQEDSLNHLFIRFIRWARVSLRYFSEPQRMQVACMLGGKAKAPSRTKLAFVLYSFSRLFDV